MAILIDKTKCIYCGGCTSVCPANALELKETFIDWDPKRCTSCGSCIKFCPAGAMKMVE